MYLVIPYIYLWTGVQPASMPFEEFITVGGPVALLGIAIYLYVQRWLCHPERERGLHWRGLSLKVACWPVYLLGTVLGVARAEVPYIPTAKEARKGRFLHLAWPHLALAAVYGITLAWTVYRRLVLTPEAALFLTSEAVWGMVAFASLAMLLASGGIRAAWEARRPPAGTPWDVVDVAALEAGSEAHEDRDAPSSPPHKETGS